LKFGLITIPIARETLAEEATALDALPLVARAGFLDAFLGLGAAAFGAEAGRLIAFLAT
jgi:hypothetical protein